MKGAAVPSALYGNGQAFSNHTSRVEVPPGAIVTVTLDFGLRPARGRRRVEADFDPVDDGLRSWAVGTALKGAFWDFLRMSMEQSTPPGTAAQPEKEGFLNTTMPFLSQAQARKA